MAGIGNSGKKPIFFSRSNGEREVKSDSIWNPGRATISKRASKDHFHHAASTHLRYANRKGM